MDRATRGRALTSLEMPELIIPIWRAAELLDISEAYCRRQVKAGVIPSIKQGRRLQVPVEALREYVRRQTEWEQPVQVTPTVVQIKRKASS